LINHSNSPSLNAFHGRAIRLFPSDSRLPFHGAFLIHEMRVRGHNPFAHDSRIPLPIGWQSWIGLAPDDDGGEDDGGDDGEDDGEDGGDEDNFFKTTHPDMERHSRLTTSMIHIPPSSQGYYTQSRGISPQQPDSGNASFEYLQANPPSKFLTLGDPFANPAEMKALKRSFVEQPNWKAAIKEGEKWEGSSQENTNKYQGIIKEYRGLVGAE
jgi:hypothetical protein